MLRRLVVRPPTRRISTGAVTRAQASLEFPPASKDWSQPPSSASVSESEIARLASKPRRPLTLADLAKLVARLIELLPY